MSEQAGERGVLLLKYLAPDYVYTSEGLVADLAIGLNEQGQIGELVPRASVQSEVVECEHMLALPGFVNTHSHVFQRALRGHTHRALSRQDTFWTWRRAMYAEAGRLDPDSLYESALQTYREMVQAGYTSVGEFHYVHHQPSGQPYADPNAMARAVLEAGKTAGIRVVLLMVAYAQAGFGLSPEEGQLRFCDASVEDYLARVETLRLEGVPIGLAPHSVRAVPENWFRAIASYSQKYRLPLHVHVDEQVSEIEQCRAAHGCTPIELLARFGVLGPLTTLVHATHANPTELALVKESGTTVCVCPTTEGDLGDGIAPYAELLESGIALSIGADSNTRLDPIEELRWAEYTARMRYQRRRVLIDSELAAPGRFLLTMGTRAGASALGLDTGVIEPGMQADFVLIDRREAALRGWTNEDLLDTIFFGTSAQIISQTWVQGRRV